MASHMTSRMTVRKTWCLTWRKSRVCLLALIVLSLTTAVACGGVRTQVRGEHDVAVGGVHR